MNRAELIALHERLSCHGKHQLIDMIARLTDSDKALEDKCIRLTKELEAHKKCDVCCGDPISDKPCICGGTGTNADEKMGLRNALYQTQKELKELKQHRIDKVFLTSKVKELSVELEEAKAKMSLSRGALMIDGAIDRAEKAEAECERYREALVKLKGQISYRPHFNMIRTTIDEALTKDTEQEEDGD